MSGTIGTVSLVGAGPGDIGLLTLRGRDLLAAADVVLCDALANPRLLNHCRPDARIVSVGKRAGQHAMQQHDINALLVAEAKAGHRVVRLKGGDPFVFGRGGEECLALAAAGVPFEVVPGVTAGIAALAYAGIPITHRDYNSSFTLITGHKGDCTSKALATDPTAIDWAAVARLPCVAFYMGTKALPDICARLMENGMPPVTPAATVSRGTTAMQRTIVGTLADLPERLAGADVATPALTIVGKVVELRATLNWFETRPLFGRTIVVTRSRQSKSAFIDKLEALGARVLEAPTIKFFESTDATAIESALAGGELPWDWVIFPSDTGVAYAKRKLFDMGLDCRAFGRAKIAVMGNATAAAVREQMGLRVDLTPPRFVAESLADELERLGQVAGQRFLILRADIGRPTLRDRLHRAGAAEVRDVPIYETRAAATLPDDVRDALAANAVDWITFTSSSTATNFTAMLGPDYRHALAHVRLASIGPVTTDTLTALGLRVDAQAAEFNIDGLVDAVTLFHGRAPAAGGSSTGPGVGSPTAY